MSASAHSRRACAARGPLAVAALVLVALVAGLLGSARAASFKPPPLNGHVVDMTGQLSAGDVGDLDAKLEATRQRTGFAIVALVLGPLDGEPIEDIGYKAGNAWQVGDKGKDNGVLLLIAPTDRKVRIETGKGVGGALTDLQSNDIIRNDIAPALREGRLRDAIDKGTDAITAALVQGTPGGGSGGAPARATNPRSPQPQKLSPLTMLVGAGVVVVVVILLIVSPAFRSIFLFLIQILFIFGGRGGGGGGAGGGGGGGSGYSGGGGRFGGGGSSDDY